MSAFSSGQDPIDRTSGRPWPTPITEILYRATSQRPNPNWATSGPSATRFGPTSAGVGQIFRGKFAIDSCSGLGAGDPAPSGGHASSPPQLAQGQCHRAWRGAPTGNCARSSVASPSSSASSPASSTPTCGRATQCASGVTLALVVSWLGGWVHGQSFGPHLLEAPSRADPPDAPNDHASGSSTQVARNARRS